MLHLLASWLISALALWIVAQLMPGIKVRDFASAMIAAAVIAIVNFFLGPVFRFFAFPITVLTLGLFLLVINGLLLKVASLFTPGFAVHGFLSAIAGSVVLTFLNWLIRTVVRA